MKTVLRLAAVLRLSDQAVLGKVACHDTDIGVCATALEKLTDVTGLGQVALRHPDVTIRSCALRKLSDETLLAKTAAEDKDEEVRRLANGRVENRENHDTTIPVRTPLP